jgi:hypothetical protein
VLTFAYHQLSKENNHDPLQQRKFINAIAKQN